MESPVCLDSLDKSESQESRVYLAELDQKDRREKEVSLDYLDKTRLRSFVKDRRECVARPVPTGRPDLLVLAGRSEVSERLGRKE